MLKKILLAFDGSQHSLRAAEYAQKMAVLEGASVEILHVRETAKIYANRIDYDVKKVENELIEEAEKVLAVGVEQFRNSSIVPTARILTGDPAEVICDEAEKQGVTEIIIGSRGLNAVSRFLMGSVSTKVLNHAHCTVIIVK